MRKSVYIKSMLCGFLLQGSCEEGWKPFKETACYYFSGTVQSTFLGAQSACEEMGASLTSIHDLDEQYFIACKFV